MKSAIAFVLVSLMRLNVQAQVLPNEASTTDALNRARPLCAKTTVGKSHLHQLEEAFVYLKIHRNEFEPDTLLIHDADLNRSIQALEWNCEQYLK